MADLLEKRSAEVRYYAFEFKLQAEIAAGDSLSATPTPTVTSDIAGLTIGPPTIAGTQVQVKLSGGTSGATYNLACQASTVGGSVLVCEGTLLVQD